MDAETSRAMLEALHHMRKVVRKSRVTPRDNPESADSDETESEEMEDRGEARGQLDPDCEAEESADGNTPMSVDDAGNGDATSEDGGDESTKVTSLSRFTPRSAPKFTKMPERFAAGEGQGTGAPKNKGGRPRKVR